MPRSAVLAGGENIELEQAQSADPGNYESAFGVEDLPSNSLGVELTDYWHTSPEGFSKDLFDLLGSEGDPPYPLSEYNEVRNFSYSAVTVPSMAKESPDGIKYIPSGIPYWDEGYLEALRIGREKQKQDTKAQAEGSKSES